MKRGLALILVVGLLGVLAVLGTAFMILSRLERQAVRQRVLASKAALLARSGLEDAVARLCNGQDPSAKWLRYGGEDWNDDGALDAFESPQEVFQAGTVNRQDCPVRQALRPSFFAADPSGAPKYRPMEGRCRGWSGGLSEDLLYALKVEDESGKLNVNGGFLDALDRDADGIPDHRDTSVPAPHPGPPVPAFVVSQWGYIPNGILNSLGTELGIGTLGNRIVQNRPLGGYRSVEDVETVIGATTDLSPYLCVRSWIDFKVIQTRAGLGPAAWAFWGMSDVKKNRPAAPLCPTGRPPVNLNAAPRPVLVALMRNLRGTSFGRPSGPFQIVLNNMDLVREIADRMMARRDAAPFSEWWDFHAFCDSLIPTCISGFNINTSTTSICPYNNLAAADLLKANFNPNSISNKELADAIAWRWIDKSDVATRTTEGSLGPTGAFRASSIGRVLDRDGRVLAQAEASAEVEAFRMLRQTTQKDFVGNRALWEDPPPQGRYLSLATLPERTAGASAGAAWWGNGPPPVPARGLAVLTGPSPPLELAASGPSETDGSISLATVEVDPDAAENGTLMFLHHFDDSWDADFGAVTAHVSGTWDSQLQGNAQAPRWNALGQEPGTLQADGAHIQVFRGIGWTADPIFPPDTNTAAPSNHGAFGYWAKELALYSDGGLHLSCIRQFPPQNGLQGDEDTQLLLLGRGGNGWNGWGMLFESRAVFENVNGDERQYAVIDARSSLMPDLRWRLFSAHFDSDESTLDHDLIFSVQGCDPTTSDRTAIQYPFPLNNTFNCTDLFQGTVFKFGVEESIDYPGQTPWNVPQVGSFVLDEFAVCDFTDAGAAAIAAFGLWKDARWKEGRYYKGDDGAFLSQVLLPDGGLPATLLRARWTAYLPREKHKLVSSDTSEDFNAWTHSTPVDGTVDPRLARSRVELELAEEDGDRIQDLTQDGPVSRRLSSFRYRVRFKSDVRDPATGLPDALNQPVLETPIFDDITFYYQRPGGARFLDWGRPGP